MASKKHRTIGMGGTFDHFHKGHEQFILFAHDLADHLVIGITSEKLTLNKPLAHTIEDFRTRWQNVNNFCNKHHISCELVELNDLYGPTLENSPIHALCVTPETIKGSDKINEARSRLGLYQFPVYICPMVPDENGEEIHSVRIRAGQINRQGTVYANLFRTDLKLTDKHRAFFGEVQGELVNVSNFTPNDTYQSVCVVGDKSLETFIENKWRYTLGVYDQKQQRQEYVVDTLKAIQPELIIPNTAGNISHSLVKALQLCLKNKYKHLLVQGEEDVAAIVLFLLLPLGSIVYYGQPNVGLVQCHITEKFKEKIYTVLAS